MLINNKPFKQNIHNFLKTNSCQKMKDMRETEIGTFTLLGFIFCSFVFSSEFSTGFTQTHNRQD